jgi:hypothetical protein
MIFTQRTMSIHTALEVARCPQRVANEARPRRKNPGRYGFGASFSRFGG